MGVVYFCQQVKFVLRNTTYSFAPITDTPYMVVLVTPTDLWVTESHSKRSEVKFSPRGGRGQCYSGRGLCEGLQRVEGSQQTSGLTLLTGIIMRVENSLGVFPFQRKMSFLSEILL